ncbi:MAG: ferrous iron transport protein A [Lachnospiraceae bacterium]
MQSLSKAMAGDACTVKWMFGVPELLRYLRANHIEEGSAVQVDAELLGKL